MQPEPTDPIVVAENAANAICQTLAELGIEPNSEIHDLLMRTLTDFSLKKIEQARFHMRLATGHMDDLVRIHGGDHHDPF